ncbi:MAG: TolC family protein [Planctomycetota bacterium]|jgi:cobalt-zinc-cadmium efflux system outer membrane protein
MSKIELPFGASVLRRILALACTMLVVTTLGCRTSGSADDQPASRPLGRDLPTYEPPAYSDIDLASPADEQPVEPNTPITLRQSLALALLHNPALQSFSWQLRAQEANILQQSLSPNPVLGAKVENFGGSDPMNSFEGAMTTFRISQLIELGDKRVKRTRLAEKNHALSAWDYEAKRLQVITEVARRFIEVLADQHRVELSQQTLDLAQQLYDIVKDRARVGVIPTVEVDKSVVRVSTEQIILNKARLKLESSRQLLSAMWGNPAPTFAGALGDLTDVEDIPTQDHLMELVHQNPDIARWSTEIAQRRAALELAQSQAVPSASVIAGVRRFSADDENALVFELGLPLPIVDRNQGGRQEAQYNLHKAKSQQKDAEIRVRTLLVAFHKTLAGAHHEVVTLRDTTLPAARSAYDAARKAFENGLTNYIDVLDAERTLVSSERRYIEALSLYHQTLTALEGLLGQSLAPPPADES